jgi:hypothetical protein
LILFIDNTFFGGSQIGQLLLFFFISHRNVVVKRATFSIFRQGFLESARFFFQSTYIFADLKTRYIQISSGFRFESVLLSRTTSRVNVLSYKISIMIKYKLHHILKVSRSYI